MLDIMQDYLSYKHYTYERIDGSVRADERWLSLERFTNSQCQVFLLSTRAAGVGLNLIAADTVILYDSSWNPQWDLQAISRAHRQGQTKPVTVYRLLMEHTIEEIVYRRSQKKLKLSNDIMDMTTINDNNDDINKENSNLLRQCLLYGLSHNLDDGGNDYLNDEKVVKLLDSAKVIKNNDDNKDDNSSENDDNLYYYEGCDYAVIRKEKENDEDALLKLKTIPSKIKEKKATQLLYDDDTSQLQGRKQTIPKKERFKALWEKNNYISRVLEIPDDDLLNQLSNDYNKKIQENDDNVIISNINVYIYIFIYIY